MNFSNLQISGKGTTRKSTIGSTRESNFGVRFANYTKQTKGGPVKVTSFVFSNGAMKTTQLEKPEFAANIVSDSGTGFVGIAVSNQGELFKATKRSINGKKAKAVTAPNLVKFLSDAGKVDVNFEGSQFFDLVDKGEVEGIGRVFEIVPSSEIAPRPYESEEAEAAQEEVENAYIDSTDAPNAEL